jgi:CHAT domain-containing protein
MSVNDYHILHFDGHGLFARRCPACAEFNQPQAAGCHACTASLEQVPAQGYLVFEDRFGDADYVNTEAMENLLIGGEVRLILLSACQSGVVPGESLFGGLGPGLIRAGVPAVVGMQLSVPVEDAVHFARGFYTALAEGETVARAVAEGRRRLFRAQSWFIPTLYLRSTGGEGRLFLEP